MLWCNVICWVPAFDQGKQIYLDGGIANTLSRSFHVLARFTIAYLIGGLLKSGPINDYVNAATKRPSSDSGREVKR